MAVAALSGCVSVEPPPTAPAPPQEIGRPVQDVDVDVAPQIVEGPAREALEAALPSPPPPSPRATHEQRKGKGKGKDRDKGKDGAALRKGKGRPSSVPHPRVPSVKPPAMPEPPRSRADVCALGEQYGGWRPDSAQAKICRGTYKN